MARTYQFDYYVPTHIYFGDGAIEHLDKCLSAYGKKVLVVFMEDIAKATGIYDTVTEMFKEKGYEWFEFTDISPNPRLRQVVAGAEICRKEGVEVILAIGGGSVIDCSKAIAAITNYDGEDPWAPAENPTLIKDPLPIVTICTMASTGSEMDGGAVITNEDINVKGGYFGIDGVLMPKASILDPKYTYSVPKRQVAAGCADIFIHTVENYFDPANDIYLVDGFAEAIMRTIVKYAPRALEEPDNFEVRANLQWAAPWAINGLLNGGRMSGWTLHGLQHPTGAFHDIIHGEGLAILMPHWLRYILSDKTVDKIATYGVNVFDIDKNQDKYEIANQAIAATEDFFFNKLHIPTKLSDVGVTDEHFEEMAEQAVAMGGMYVPLTKEDVINIYKAAL